MAKLKRIVKLKQKKPSKMNEKCQAISFQSIEEKKKT